MKPYPFLVFLAAHELDELKNASEGAAKYQTEFKGKPITKIIEPMTAEPVAQLEKAIETQGHYLLSAGL